MYPIVVSGRFNCLGAKVFWFCIFWRFILGYFLEGFCFGDIVGISICRTAFLDLRSFLEEYEKHW